MPACAPSAENAAGTDERPDQQTADADDDASAGQPMPPIHVELIEEPLDGGRNIHREAYQGLLQSCGDAGFPITPLAPDQVDQLGTARVKLWFSDQVRVLSRESWSFEKDPQPRSCNFRLVREGLHSRTDTDGVVETDLGSGEVTRQAADPGLLERFPAEAGDSVMAALGYQGPTRISVAGEPCAQWTNRTGATVCLWSGGRAWGFSDAVGASGCSPSPLSTYENSIVLQQAPPSEGVGCRVTTVQFTVGTVFGEREMAPPRSLPEAS
ncbi:MAG: hypothetical protein ACREO4_10735 [Lysobacter sp.]